VRKQPLLLYVGVRFFWGEKPGTLDIDVLIDGKPVSEGDTFPTAKAKKKPDSFSVGLDPGLHRLTARSVSQGASFEVGFEMGTAPRYAELSYDYYPKDHEDYGKYRPFDPESTSGHREGFTFSIQDRDFGWR
jgi:hypothetical protein